MTNKAVTEADARAYAQKLNVSFIETSAKDGANVDAAFTTMARELIKARY